MNKTIIKFRAIEGQELERIGNLRNYAPDTKNYIEARFELGPQWQGFDKLYVAWSTGQRVEFTDVPESGIVVIPETVLSISGVLKANLVGEEYNDPAAETKTLTARLTTFPVEVLKLSYRH